MLSVFIDRIKSFLELYPVYSRLYHNAKCRWGGFAEIFYTQRWMIQTRLYPPKNLDCNSIVQIDYALYHRPGRVYEISGFYQRWLANPPLQHLHIHIITLWHKTLPNDKHRHRVFHDPCNVLAVLQYILSDRHRNYPIPAPMIANLKSRQT